MRKIEKATTRIGVPPATRDCFVARIVSAKYVAQNSSGNQMVTVEPELVGVPNRTGGCEPEINVGGVQYVISGAFCRPQYFSFVDNQMGKWQDFLAAAHKLDEDGSVTIPESQEELDGLGLEGLLLEVIVSAREVFEKKILTPEQKEARQEADNILDGDGNPITRMEVNISRVLRPYSGSLPEGF